MLMQAAKRPRADRTEGRLLVIDPTHATIADRTIRDLPALLEPGDLLIVNDAATLPASFFATTVKGEPVEVRLAGHEGGSRWRAVLFGRGDWRTPTEHRPSPPVLARGDRLDFGRGTGALIVEVSRVSPRLVELELDGAPDEMWSAIYALGRPVQYSYLAGDLRLDDVQVGYGARPWSVEMPSAGRPLAWSILFALFDRGVAVRALTHAAGLSSTGDPVLDAALPLEERFEIPEATVRAVHRAKAEHGRVIAVGTTVVRALEGAASARGGSLAAGRGSTSIFIDGTYTPKIADGILSGIHEPNATHFSMLEAFAPRALLERAHEHAVAGGYLGHEFGDSCLIAPSR